MRLSPGVTGQDVDIGFSSLKFQSLVWPGSSLPQPQIWLSQGRKEGGKISLLVQWGEWLLLPLVWPCSVFSAFLQQRWS